MRKFISALFLLLFLLSLPNLLSTLTGDQTLAFKLGAAAVPAIFLAIGVKFWKPAAPKE